MKKKTKRSKKSKTKEPPLPAKLFKGKTVVLAGRFSDHPDKNDLILFLQEQGARLTAKVGPDTDIVLLGEGSSAVEKRVRKLNESGRASIEYSDDIFDFLIFEREQEQAVLGDPQSFRNMRALPHWLSCTFDFSDGDYTGATIGKAGNKNYCSLEAYHLGGATFDRAKLTNVTFGEMNYGSNSFEATEFNNVTFSHPSRLVLNNPKARELGITFAKHVTIRGGKIDGFDSYDLDRCSFDDVKIKSFQSSPHFLIKKCVFKKCSFVDTDLNGTDFVDCTFDQCEFSKGQLRNIRFEKCTFQDVKFRGMAISEIEWRKCVLKNVTLQAVDLFDVDFASSKIASLKFLRMTKQSFVRISPEQLASAKGISKSAIAQQVKTAAAKRLSRAMKDSGDIGASFKVKDKKETYTVSFYGNLFRQGFRCKSKSNDESTFVASHLRRSRVLSLADTLRGLSWLSSRVYGKSPEFATLKISTSKCPLSKKELNALLTTVITEICGSEPVDADSVASQRRAKSKSLKQQRTDILENLQGGNVAAVNAIPAAQLKELKNFRNMSVLKQKLPKVELRSVELNGSDFSGCDLRGADFTGSDCQRVNFTNCDLRKAIFTKADLRQVVFDNADLRGAVFDGNGMWNGSMVGADLRGVNLEDCVLARVDMTGAKMGKTKLTKALYDDNTVFSTDMSHKQWETMRPDRWH